MNEEPVIGRRVKLNDNGFKTIGGIQSRKMYKQSKDMLITFVDPTNLIYDHNDVKACAYMVEVDQPLINVFLITSLDIDYIDDKDWKG